MPEPKQEIKKREINPKLVEMGINRIPGVGELYSDYDYAEPKPPEQKELDMEWSPQLKEQTLQTASELMAQEYYPGQEKYLAINEQTRLKISTFRGMESGADSFRIDLENTTQERPAQIASFFVQKEQKEGEWKLAHRVVMPEYRNKGIGAQMLKLMEASIQQIADKTNQQQSINIEAGQIGVITFATNHGYSPESEQDQNRLKQIFSGDSDNLFIVTAGGYASDGGPRPGFIYSKENIQKEVDTSMSTDKEEDYLDDNGKVYDWPEAVDALSWGDPEPYEKMAYNVNLKKELKPAA